MENNEAVVDMHYGFMQTQYRQAFCNGSESSGNGKMDGVSFYRNKLLPALHAAGRCLMTKSDGALPFLSEKLPDRIIAVFDGGVTGYFQVDPNPGIELRAPYDAVTSSVFRSLIKEADRNDLKLEYKPRSRTEVFRDLRKLANGEEIDI